jgi:hypothetical protein
MDEWTAEGILRRSGAQNSWSACFIQPNAWCPVCFKRVFYYQNEHGSRVFFDEIGGRWPKHPCTDSSLKSESSLEFNAPVIRSSNEMLEVYHAVQKFGLDPAAKYIADFGEPAWDILSVIRVVRVGFDNFIHVKSVAPPREEPLFITFVSGKLVPKVGEFLGFNGSEVSLLEPETFESRRIKCRVISQSEFPSSGKG